MVVSLFNEVAGLQMLSCAQMFTCEICEIFKNTYFEEDLRSTAFVWEWLHFHEVFLVQKCYQQLEQKSELNISN